MAYATAATLELHAPGVGVAVDAVSPALIPTALRMSMYRVGNVEVWGDDQADAHASLALHWLDRGGHLARAGYESDGEHGPLLRRTTSSAGGGNTFEYNALPVQSRDATLASTQWGRQYLEIWQAKRGSIGPTVVR